MWSGVGNKCMHMVSAGMVHTCVVPGCHNRSNKSNCKGLKFYTLPTAKKIREVWLSLVGRKCTEVTFHSRICSEHFVHGKKTKESIPEIFPWQKHTCTTTSTVRESHSTSLLATTSEFPTTSNTFYHFKNIHYLNKFSLF